MYPKSKPLCDSDPHVVIAGGWHRFVEKAHRIEASPAHEQRRRRYPVRSEDCRDRGAKTASIAFRSRDESSTAPYELRPAPGRSPRRILSGTEASPATTRRHRRGTQCIPLGVPKRGVPCFCDALSDGVPNVVNSTLVESLHGRLGVVFGSVVDDDDLEVRETSDRARSRSRGAESSPCYASG